MHTSSWCGTYISTWRTPLHSIQVPLLLTYKTNTIHDFALLTSDVIFDFEVHPVPTDQATKTYIGHGDKASPIINLGTVLGSKHDRISVLLSCLEEDTR